MIIKKEIYEILKVIGNCVPAIVTFLSAALAVLGVGDGIVLAIVTIVSAIGTLLIAVLNIFGKNHWKIVAEDGEIADIPEHNEIVEEG